MISFAQNFSKIDKRALKAAALSTIPGLGQLFNKRLDKAIAFFLVNLANIVLVAALMGYRLPCVELNAEHFLMQLNSWRPGTAPFVIIQLMIISYVIYSQVDAYRDALSSAVADKKPELSLSHTTCASYVLHISGIFAVCLLILVKVFPDFHPTDLNQISLSFELEPAVDQHQEQKAIGEQGQTGEQSNQDEVAHLKDRPKDEVKASSPSAEMSASQQKSPIPRPAAEELDTAASKQVISPNPQQSPKEIASQGSSDSARETIKTPDEQKKIAEAPADPSSVKDKKSEEIDENNDHKPAVELANLEKPKLLAQLPPSVAAASGMAMNIDRSNASSGAPMLEAKDYHGTVGSTLEPWTGNNNGTKIDQTVVDHPSTIVNTGPVASLVGLQQLPPIATPSQAVDSTNDPYSFNQGSTTTGQSGGNAPAMLGFMDSTLSNDPDMRYLWSQVSGNISRTVKAQPLQGEGMAVATFTLTRTGQISDLQTSDPQTELVQSLTNTLFRMPKVTPPSKQVGKMFFQVKTSKKGEETFVSVEINSQPTPITTESMSDFTYQVNLQAYLKGIKKAVYSSWKPPVQEGIKPVMVGFKVSTDGSISSQHVVQSSGDPKMDRAALNAALSVTRWTQPPAGTSEDMDVCMVLQKCKSCDAEKNNSKATNAAGGDPRQQKLLYKPGFIGAAVGVPGRGNAAMIIHSTGRGVARLNIHREAPVVEIVPGPEVLDSSF